MTEESEICLCAHGSVPGRGRMVIPFLETGGYRMETTSPVYLSTISSALNVTRML